MSNAMHDHLRRFPKCRPSTLAYLEKRAETTAQLRREISDMKKQRRRSWLFWIWRRA
jgi:hypothetical protein